MKDTNIKQSKLPYIISTTALIIAIVAICFSYIRTEPLQADWASILVGISTLLVTLLVGWQIYNAIEINRKVSRIEANFFKIEQNVQKQIDNSETINNRSLSGIQFIQGLAFRESGIFNSYLCFLKSIRYGLMYVDSDTIRSIKSAIHYLRLDLDQIKQIKGRKISLKNNSFLIDLEKFKKEIIEHPNFGYIKEEFEEISVMQESIFKEFEFEFY